MKYVFIPKKIFGIYPTLLVIVIPLAGEGTFLIDLMGWKLALIQRGPVRA